VKVPGGVLLICSALASFALAGLHVVIIAIGAPAYLYFGAAGLAERAGQGSLAPALLTSCITVVFIVFGLYALAGAGVIGRLPFLRAGLVMIGSVYTLRGLEIVFDVMRLIRNAGYPARQTLFSSVSLAIGLLYLAGTASRRRVRSAEPLDWPFVGTWRLVAFESHDESGGLWYPMGRDVHGLLTYVASGTMSVLLARADLPRFASEDLHGGSDAEVRAAFNGFFGYFGTYSVNAPEGTVTHHLEAASFPNWVGVDQRWFFKASGEQLVLSAPPIGIEGRQAIVTLTWERLAAAR
jgi:hypothetical protein